MAESVRLSHLLATGDTSDERRLLLERCEIGGDTTVASAAFTAF